MDMILKEHWRKYCGSVLYQGSVSPISIEVSLVPRPHPQKEGKESGDFGRPLIFFGRVGCGCGSRSIHYCTRVLPEFSEHTTGSGFLPSLLIPLFYLWSTQTSCHMTEVRVDWKKIKIVFACMIFRTIIIIMEFKCPSSVVRLRLLVGMV